jgi:hypothetical protein
LLAALAACQESQAQRSSQGIDPAKRGWYGEFYDLEAYERCVRTTNDPRNRQCDYLRLTRVEEPEYWPYPRVPRPKLPEAPNPPIYKKGMSSKRYFDALCKAEAGEFIYRTIDNVEGVYQIRPRRPVGLEVLMDRYVLEDPYGYTSWEAEDPRTLFVDPPYRQYSFIEVPAAGPKNEPRFTKLSGGKNPPSDDSGTRTVLESRYGFLWRGIQRLKDRELAIAGGELIIVDLTSGEILAVRRGFARSGFVRNSRSGIQWESAEVCPRLRRTDDGFDKWPSFTYSFVSKVLRPAAQK